MVMAIDVREYVVVHNVEIWSSQSLEARGTLWFEARLASHSGSPNSILGRDEVKKI